MKESNSTNAISVFLETAHPIKFLDVVESALNITLKMPDSLKELVNKEKVATEIGTYEELKNCKSINNYFLEKISTSKYS